MVERYTHIHSQATLGPGHRLENTLPVEAVACEPRTLKCKTHSNLPGTYCLYHVVTTSQMLNKTGSITGTTQDEHIPKELNIHAMLDNILIHFKDETRNDMMYILYKSSI